MQPSIGRIVHYVSHGTPPKADGTQAYTSLPRAAIITAVHGSDPVPEHGVPYVDLCVLNPTGLFFNTNVKFDEGGTSDTPGAPTARSYEGGTWHWPPRV
jgi:hypothetical protein